ncbi:MAG: hypothetical protein J0L75_02870 [Spirochaetes bacterium]|nr:hypothetical protein [Spirochaetota bacterium]
MRESNQTDFDPSQFADPGPAFRSIPFWSLNDRLDPAEIKRQLAAFKEGGFGGAYLHSRIGLLTPYLGADWWRAMDAAVDACGELGLEAWFYDEDKWPSGFAGGIVPRLDADFRSKALLRLKRGDPVPPTGVVLAEAGEWAFVEWTMPMGDPWFNGTAWVDLLNPRCVAAFIDCSYRPYVERYRGRACVRGIFTDEPQLSPSQSLGRFPIAHHGALAWSPHLRARYRGDHGEDVVDRAAELFEPRGDWKRTRWRFHRSLTAQFEAAFTRPIAEYCGKHGFAWTGHFNGEGGFRSTTDNVGSMAAQYRHMQRPGVDWLGLRIKGGQVTLKTLSSTANQCGQGRRLSELFGCAGQDMSAEDRAWIFGWHALHGVNHACPHLSLYTLRGVRKRDYPPTLSPHQPWWPENHRLEASMARLSYAATAGNFDADLLVLSPLESAWCEFPEKSVDARSGDFEALLAELGAAGRDYDLGDESVLCGLAVPRNGFLEVGEARYRAVLLPSLATVRRETLAWLAAFLDQGGRVYSCGERPTRVDGADDPAALEPVLSRIPAISRKRLGRGLEARLPAAVRVLRSRGASPWKKAPPVMLQMRRTDSGRLCLVFNPSRLETARFALRFRDAAGGAACYDPATGVANPIDVTEGGRIELCLAPAQSVVLALDAPLARPAGSGDAGVEGLGPVVAPAKCISKLTGPWRLRRLDPNALPLDFASWSLAGESGEDAEPLLGLMHRFTARKLGGPIRLRFEVEAADLPQRCRLAWESPNMDGRWSVNGAPLTGARDAGWLDACMRSADIAPLMRLGRNRIELELDFTPPIPASSDPIARYGTELEAVYLIGDFKVEATPSSEPVRSPQWDPRLFIPKRVHRFVSWRLAKEDPPAFGDLTPQGYPFYAGRFAAETRFTLPDTRGNLFLRFAHPAVQAIRAELNGSALGTLTRSPWECALQGAARRGENALALELTGSLRNLLGPHHHKDGELVNVGPESFVGQPTWGSPLPKEPDWYERRKTGNTGLWRDDRYVIAFGLTEAPRILRRDGGGPRR